jgi:ABC-2 type transport system permease protein
MSSERGLRSFTVQAWLLAGRNVRGALTVSSISGMVLSPLLFLLAFTFVFKSLLADRGIDYAQYLPPAIIVQSMMLVAMSSAFYLAGERRSGLLNRWRTMPVHRVAVLAGRLLVDAARAAVSLVVIVVVGFGLGFRLSGGPLRMVGFVLLAVAFAVCLAAGAATVGAAAASPEVVMSLLFLPYLPLLTLSTAYMPVTAFPGWLQPVVRASPVSANVDALRWLAGSGPSSAWWPALVWIAGIGLVFGVSAVRAFGRRR